MKYGDKITTRLRPDVDRRLRTFALVRGARITHVINDALDEALPGMDDIAAMVAHTVATAARRGGGHRWRPPLRSITAPRAGTRSG